MTTIRNLVVGLLMTMFGCGQSGKHTDKLPSMTAYDKPNIDALLASKDKNNSVIELDNYICKVCAWGENLDKLTEQQKTFFYNQELEREINNGGFNQYFWNSAGDYSHKTVISLRTIGANKTADILQSAIDQFPNKTVPTDGTKRQYVLEQIEDKSNPIWEELDSKFFKYEDDLNSLNLDYVKQNKNAF